VSYHDEEPTRAPLRPPLRAVSAPPQADELHTLGLVMAATARIETRLRDLETLPSEVRALRAEIRDDRDALVHGASKHAANHSSNRLAALMTALFTLYELSSPYLRELWALLVRK
jgi:hypothetical protein